MPVQRNECPVEIVFSMLSGRWKIPIYRFLYKNSIPVRYSELLRHLPSISKKILTEQLRELERDGIIDRTSYPEPRPRVEYTLTPKGRTMIELLDSMSGGRSTSYLNVRYQPLIRLPWTGLMISLTRARKGQQRWAKKLRLPSWISYAFMSTIA